MDKRGLDINQYINFIKDEVVLDGWFTEEDLEKILNKLKEYKGEDEE